MRLFLFMLLPIASLSCRHVQQAQIGQHNPGGPNRWLLDWKFENRTYDFEASEAFLRAASKWQPDKSRPPCSPGNAEAAAVREAQRLRPDVPGWVRDGIELREISGDCWIYVVRLYRSDFIMGQPASLSIPVLMNGEAVRPK